MTLPRVEPETTTMSIPDRSTFESAYAGQPPWEIGRAQNEFVDTALSFAHQTIMIVQRTL